MRNYKNEISKMLPGDTEFDKLLRKELLSFIDLFNEIIPQVVDYDRDVPTWYNERNTILILYKHLQNDYIITQQRITIFKHQLVQLKDKIQKIEHEPPLWDSINLQGKKQHEQIKET